MLSDNAQLAHVYLHAWQVTGNEFFRTVTEEILDYVMREMLDPAGVQMLRTQHLPSSSTSARTAGFYSTHDAESEGEERKFFVWTPDEIREVLGDEADAFMAAYGVSQDGNFEASAPGSLGARASSDSSVPWTSALPWPSPGASCSKPARSRLTWAVTTCSRHKRQLPSIAADCVGRIAKALTSWNGLMLAAFAEAARALDRDDGSRALAASYRLVAERNADFLLSELRQESGRLLRTWKQGEAKLNGYLEDYSYLIEGLLELYQTTFESKTNV
jgi:uncharacterized protein YyaL (SSP411 family)